MKKSIHLEAREETHLNLETLGIHLQGLVDQAEDALDLEGLLNKAINSLYLLQPNGRENYSFPNPKIGLVRLCQANNQQGPGYTDITYSPSPTLQEYLGYVQTGIGTINLRKKTYSVDWKNSKETNNGLPPSLMKDTETVMKCLGLEKEIQK